MLTKWFAKNIFIKIEDFVNLVLLGAVVNFLIFLLPIFIVSNTL